MRPRRPRSLLPLVALLGLLASAAPAVAQGTGVVAGSVVDENGNGLAGAQVNVVGTDRGTQTNERGEYRLPGIPDGAWRIAVRRLGFNADTAIVRVDSNQTRRLDFTLKRSALTLSTVEVRGATARPRRTGPLADFYERADRRLAGRFITREDIDRRNPMLLTDMFRMLPGVRVEPLGPGRNAVRVRNNQCYPVVVMDGARMTTAGEPFDIDQIRVTDIEGVEVYASGNDVPPQFSGPGSQCGTIVIWTRRGGPAQRAEQRDPAEVARELADAVASLSVYTADQVDEPVRPDPDAPISVSYPDSLAKAGVAGEVLVEFVVNERGRVEIASINVVSAADQRLAALAVAAVRGAQFIPARRRGAAVRQVVQQPFIFELRPPPAADSATPPPATPPTATPPR